MIRPTWSETGRLWDLNAVTGLAFILGHTEVSCTSRLWPFWLSFGFIHRESIPACLSESSDTLDLADQLQKKWDHLGIKQYHYLHNVIRTAAIVNVKNVTFFFLWFWKKKKLVPAHDYRQQATTVMWEEGRWKIPGQHLDLVFSSVESQTNSYKLNLRAWALWQ